MLGSFRPSLLGAKQGRPYGPSGIFSPVPFADLLAEPHTKESHSRAKRSCPGRFGEGFLLLRADLSGLPPTLIQCAGAELLAPQARALASKLLENGVPVVLDEVPGMWHDFHLHAGLVSESTGGAADR
jgi:acetyl esterase/lipase